MKAGAISQSPPANLPVTVMRPARSQFRQLCALLIALAAPGAFALNPAETPRDYILTRWDAEDGLPQSLVRQIIQTRDGYLWVGTAQGVARFDGLTFTTFKRSTTAGFPGNAITSLAETSDGNLWIGTSQGLGRYRDGHFTTYTQTDGLKSDTINGLCAAPDGSLWIASREGITRWVEGKFVQDIDTSAYDTRGMQTITADRQGGMWLATGIEALRYADGKFARFGREHGLPSTGVRSIREDAEGRLLAVTLNGLWRMGNGRFVPFQPGSVSERVNSTLVDREGNLWITSIGGLERFSGGKIELYVDPHGENPGATDAIFEDREGSLWVGGFIGLARLTNRRGRTLSTEEGLLGAAGLAVRESRDGSIWLSSWAGGVARFQNGTVRQYRAGAPLSHESVTCIYEAPDGTMWFGNRGSSVDRLEGDKVTTLVHASGVATSRYVSAMYAAPDGEFLVAIADRGLLAVRDGQLVPVPEATAFARGSIWVFHRALDGRLLVAGTQGLFERGADRSFRPVELPGITGALSIRSLMEEEDGGIWLGTDGRGLIHWKAGATRSYSEREGLIGDSVSSIVDDRAGSIWVTTTRGIVRIPRTELAQFDGGKIARLNLTTFGRVDGLANASVSTGAAPLAARVSDGRVMFATGKGFAAIDPRTLQVNRQPPTVVIESIVADDQPLDLAPGRALVVPGGTNRLEIRYTALSLVASQLLRFRYRLEGSDPGWIEAGRERSARYTHLAPGAYTFRALACNNDGVWTDTGASLAIVLQPLFYQTLWFRLAAVALAVAALVFVVGIRLRQLNRRQVTLARANAELDLRVRERTQELAGSLSMVNATLEATADGIVRIDADGTVKSFNRQFAVMWGLTEPPDALRPMPQLTTFAFPLPKRPEETGDLLARLAAHPEAESSDVIELTDGRFLECCSKPQRIDDKNCGRVWSIRDITGQRRMQRDVEQAHAQLVVASRQAGMAEVATGVLHNVGNVLNSANVSVTLVTDRVRRTKSTGVAKLAALFEEHQANLAGLMTQDRGQKVPGYLRSLAESLASEQKSQLAELDHLRTSIDHIKDIVTMQQSYAKTSGFIETVKVVDLVEDALRMNVSSLLRHDVELVRDFQLRPTIETDKHQVLQILVNLVANAKQACDESSRPDKRIVVRTSGDEESVAIAVTDNGVGIPGENLVRIFNHGFTTKKDGHGFGLHSAALAARELGGSLAVSSAGLGQGATFILELPNKVKAHAHENRHH